jgi:hypothetical protein
VISLTQLFIFKLEEEEKPSLLLLLPKVLAETAILFLTDGSSRVLVVASSQLS